MSKGPEPARHGAERDALDPCDGRSRWIEEAERILSAAAQEQRFGRFQLEAEIQSVRARTGRMALLEEIPAEAAASHQPYRALAAHLLRRLGRSADAAYERAIGLCEDPAIRAFLLRWAAES